jgi:hypothetical protein
MSVKINAGHSSFGRSNETMSDIASTNANTPYSRSDSPSGIGPLINPILSTAVWYVNYIITQTRGSISSIATASATWNGMPSMTEQRS